MALPVYLTATDVSFPGLGLNNLHIDRVAFMLGSFSVYWYGICIIAAFALCIGLAMYHSKKYGFTPDDVIDVSLVIIPAAIIGARLYYVASAWDEFSSNPLSVFDIRSGGLAVYGGVLLSIIAVIVLAKVKKQPLGALFNVLIVYIPLGQAIGRWGNFFNQEAFGTNTTLPWGMISAKTSAYISAFCPTLDPSVPVHPTFLYESIACLIIFAILLLVRRHAKMPFTVAAAYFILYGIARFFIEGLRTDSLYIGSTGLRTSQLMSAVLVVFGFVLLAVFRYRGIPVKYPTPAEAVAADVSATEQAETSSASSETDTVAEEETPAEISGEETSDDPDTVTDESVSESIDEKSDEQ